MSPHEIKMEAAMEAGQLAATIVSPAPPGAQFAFHVFRDNERIHIQPYSSRRSMRLSVGSRPGIYELFGLVRASDEMPVMSPAQRVLHAGPPIGLEEVRSRSSHLSGPIMVRFACFEWPCLFFPKPGGRLFVLLSAATDRKTHSPPVFNRRSWHARFPGSVLCVSDPTLTLSETLNLGWYLGEEKHDAMPELAKLVQAFADAVGVKTKSIVSYGSSGGGFAALGLAARLKGATAVAINPQTDVTAYRIQGVVRAMLETCFGGISAAETCARYPKRVSMLHAYAERHTSRVIYVQNRRDEHHYQKHFLPFAQQVGLPQEGGYSACGRHYAFVFDHENGHGPEPESLFPEIIAKAVQFTSPVSA